MFSKLFPAGEQLWKNQDDKGIRSRIIAYTPECLIMEWCFHNKGHVVPKHEHYHVQFSYIVKGSAVVTLADGSENLLRTGDAVSFAPNEFHKLVTQEPDTVVMDVFLPLRLDHLEAHMNG
jgi:quercetin dioxygenase-like cupin family protein